MIAGCNILPLATEMRAWMMGRGQLALMPEEAAPERGGFMNPYTGNGVTLQLLMSRVLNSAHDFVISCASCLDPIEAELERLRLYNEILLYSARFCEVAIKQLLYCTQIPEHRYKRMALGALLESPCPSCKRENGKQPHLVSMVGTLAHPFHLCMEFEHCAMDHMDLVNRLRNSQAAHSGSQDLKIVSAEASIVRFAQERDDVLNGFLHMLSHLSDLEERMISDLTLKAQAINRLKAAGLGPDECNFNLVPGEEFRFRGAVPGANV